MNLAQELTHLHPDAAASLRPFPSLGGRVRPLKPLQSTPHPALNVVHISAARCCGVMRGGSAAGLPANFTVTIH